MKNGKAVYQVIWVLAVAFLLFAGCATLDPQDVEEQEVVCAASAPTVKPGQKIKVLCWNVQYMAGKNYVFYYDLLDGSGPDKRPSSEDIAKTINEVARIINQEDPDVILLQEVDDGSKRTDKQDQLKLLLPKISSDYRCHSSAFYHKASFIPHAKIWGSVGMKLSTISKYRIDKAVRHQLALKNEFWLKKKFDLKRAVLETRLPVEGGKDLIVMNTHLSAFAQGQDTMQKQVAEIKALLDRYVSEGYGCIVGGDFNLLPPGISYSRLPARFQAYYQEESELHVLTDAYPSIPSLEETNGPEREEWFTHYPNNPAATGPDRTIDYIFYSPDLEIGRRFVRRHDTLRISDHLPVIVEIITGVESGD